MSTQRALRRLSLASALLFAATACGGDDGDSESSPTSAEVPAATTAAGTSETTAAGSSATTAAAGNDEMAAAQAVFEEFTQEPAINQPPLNAAPEPGQKVVYLDCGSPGCNMQTTYIKEAADLVGWEVEVKAHDMTDPSTLVALLEEYVNADPKPIAVLFAGSSSAVWQQLVPAYEEAGIAIVPNSDTLATKPDSPSVPAIVVTDTDSERTGTALANWFIADSEAKGKALIVNYPDVTTLDLQASTTEQVIAEGCAACSSEILDLSIVQLGGGDGGPVPAVVAALQADPSITHVVSMYSETLTGLPGALEAANISGVRVGGAYPSLENLQGLVDGTTQAWTTTNTKAYAYVMFDVALRYAEGSPIEPDDGGVPVMILTKDNVGTPSETSHFVPEDMTDQFKELWHVG